VSAAVGPTPLFPDPRRAVGADGGFAAVSGCAGEP